MESGPQPEKMFLLSLTVSAIPSTWNFPSQTQVPKIPKILEVNRCQQDTLFTRLSLCHSFLNILLIWEGACLKHPPHLWTVNQKLLLRICICSTCWAILWSEVLGNAFAFSMPPLTGLILQCGLRLPPPTQKQWRIPNSVSLPIRVYSPTHSAYLNS